MYESWVKRQEEYEDRDKLEKLEWHIPQVDCVQKLLVAWISSNYPSKNLALMFIILLCFLYQTILWCYLIS